MPVDHRFRPLQYSVFEENFADHSNHHEGPKRPLLPDVGNPEAINMSEKSPMLRPAGETAFWEIDPVNS